MEVERSDAIVSRVLGKIGNLVYTKSGVRTTTARGIYKDSGPSEKQEVQRLIYNRCDALYAELTEEEKNEWKKVKHGKGITRYSNFMHVNLIRGGKGLPLKRVP